MRIHTRAIILHTTKYGETSLIVRTYTESSGICSFIVGGVRGGGKSRFPAGVFQPLNLVEVVASGKPGTTLPRITEIQLSPSKDSSICRRAFSRSIDLITCTIWMVLSHVPCGY